MDWSCDRSSLPSGRIDRPVARSLRTNGAEVEQRGVGRCGARLALLACDASDSLAGRNISQCRTGEAVDAALLAQDLEAAAWALEQPEAAIVSRVESVARPSPRGPDQRYTGGDGALRALACAPQYAWDCGAALAVIACESGGNPAAYNPSGSYGLMQIQAYWHLDKLEAVTGSRDPALLFDAELNLVVADIIYRDSGWLPWSCRP